MCAESRILDGLVLRRALEAVIGELATISDPVQIAERAEFIAQHGRAGLAALLSALDTSDPQLRGGLGAALVALRLPQEQVVAALRDAASAQERSTHARLTALTILERYFNEPPNEELLAGLQSSEEVALQSLAELVHAMAQDPMAILEYLVQLAAQPPEVPGLILQAIPAAPFSEHLVTLLRMFAQDSDLRLASSALEQLGRIRTSGAVRALTALAETLPPSLAALAMRGVRKLRLSGVDSAEVDAAYAEPWLRPTTLWRALMSPVDGVGAQFLWFIGGYAGERGVVVSTLLEDARGLTTASGSLNANLADLPPARPFGSLYRLALGEHSTPLLLLEVPLAVGRRALQKALDLNWDSGTPTPLAYRLLNLPLWLAESAQMEELTGDPRTEVGDVGAVNLQDTAELVDHPAFWGWVWPIDEQSHPAAQMNASLERDELVTLLVQSRFGPGVVASYRRRLLRMAEWLALAHDAAAAVLARAAADQLHTGRAEEAPLLRRLVDIGLQAGELAQRGRRSRVTVSDN